MEKQTIILLPEFIMSRCNGASKAFAKKGRRTSSLKKVLCSVADGAA